MKSSIFWDITPCTLLKVNRRFGGTYRLHLQSRRINQAKRNAKAGGKQNQIDVSFDLLLLKFRIVHLAREIKVNKLSYKDSVGYKVN
jgi:hypothetical protein